MGGSFSSQVRGMFSRASIVVGYITSTYAKQLKMNKR